MKITDELFLHVFMVALTTYVEDVKTLVCSGVTDELRALENDRPGLGERYVLRTRRTALKAWTKTDYPLSYETEDYVHLLGALDPGAARTPQGGGPPGDRRRRDDGLANPTSLPAPPCQGKPVSFFVDAIFEGAESNRRAPPFVQDGAFQCMMAATLKALRELAVRRFRMSPMVDVDEHVLKPVLSKAVANLKIRHVPWTATSGNEERGEGRGRGRPSTKIVHGVWLPLGAPEPRRVGATSRVVINAGRSREARFVEASEQTALRDVGTSWSACQHRLAGYHKVLHKEVLPHEWSYLNASLPKKKSNGEEHLCTETYEWAKNVYDPTSNPLHALAMVISLVFVGMLPRVFPPTNLPQDTDMRSLANKMASMSWEERSKKGVSHAGPFVTMVSTFVMAMMDDSSPLMECMLGDGAGSRSDEVKDFFNKHSESSPTKRKERKKEKERLLTFARSLEGDIGLQRSAQVPSGQTTVAESGQVREMDSRRTTARSGGDTLYVDESASMLRAERGIRIVRRGRSPGRRAHSETLARAGSGEDSRTGRSVLEQHVWAG